MRRAHLMGLALLAAAGCADRSAPQDAARPARTVSTGDPRPLPQAASTPDQALPQAASVPDQPLPKPAVGNDKPIPQDTAKMEARRREWLAWNRRTLRDAYNKVGERDPKWDKPALEALELAARRFSMQVDPVISLADIAKPVKAAVDAGCNDPLIAFYNARFQPRKNDDETRRFKDAAKAFGASRYPAWRRAAALTMSVPGELEPGPEGDAFRKEARDAFDSALALLPESVATDEHNEFWEDMWFDTLMSILRAYRWLGMDGPAAYRKVDDALAKVPEVAVLRLQFRANIWLHYGWEARTQAFAPDVPEEAFQTLEKCLAIAREASEEAWRLRPEGSRTPSNIIEIDKAVGGDRATMELWFERALKADGDDRDSCWAKLDWLAPKWHGTPEEMLAFGRRCRETRNWRAGITLLCADAHWRFACLPGVNQNAYLASPEAWADIQSVYDEYLKHHPEDDVARNKYATFCHVSGHYREAEVQYVALGDRLAQWSEAPYVPLFQLKLNRQRNARIVLGKEGRITLPGWHFVSGKDEEGEWRVNIPVAAPHQEKPGILGADASHVWSCSAGGITYGIRALRLPAVLRGDSPERILDAARSVVAKERGAQPRNLRDTLLAARPAQEYNVEAPGLKPRQLRVKAIVIGTWLYELSVAASKSDVTGAAAREFFDSFAFQPRTP